MSVFREDTKLDEQSIEDGGVWSFLVRIGVRCKVYAKRSMGYVNMLTALGVYKVALDGTVLDPYTWYLAPVGVVLVVLLGWLEDRIGAWRYEGKFKADRNPRQDEVIERLKRVEKMVAERE